MHSYDLTTVASPSFKQLVNSKIFTGFTPTLPSIKQVKMATSRAHSSSSVSSARRPREMVPLLARAATAQQEEAPAVATVNAAGAAATDVYRVRPGDTLVALAVRGGCSERQMRRWNGMSAVSNLLPGALRVSAEVAARLAAADSDSGTAARRAEAHAVNSRWEQLKVFKLAAGHVSDEEALAYIDRADGNAGRALVLWRNDLQWEVRFGALPLFSTSRARYVFVFLTTRLSCIRQAQYQATRNHRPRSPGGDASTDADSRRSHPNPSGAASEADNDCLIC